MVVSKNPIWQQCELALNSLQETSARETKKREDLCARLNQIPIKWVNYSPLYS